MYLEEQTIRRDLFISVIDERTIKGFPWKVKNFYNGDIKALAMETYGVN